MPTGDMRADFFDHDRPLSRAPRARSFFKMKSLVLISAIAAICRVGARAETSSFDDPWGDSVDWVEAESTSPALSKEDECESEYFPDGAFSLKPDGHCFKVRWYSKHLAAMNEPSLLDPLDENVRSLYRFLWLRTFQEPISIRLVIHADGTGVLNAVMLDGAGGYDPGDVQARLRTTLTASTVDRFLDRLNTSDFWNRTIDDRHLGYWQLTEHSEWMRTRVIGYDGAQWILEGREADRYNIFEQWSPRSGPFRDLCLKLVRLSGIAVEEGE